MYVCVHMYAYTHTYTYMHVCIHTHTQRFNSEIPQGKRKLNEFEYVKKSLQRDKAVLAYCLGGQMAPLAEKRGEPGLVKFEEKMEKA